MAKHELSDRYDRNFNTLSPKNQIQLKKSTVAVLGLGGLGGSVCEMLARIGVGNLIVVDGDVFETSNLNRQLFSTEDLIGASKAVAAKNRIQQINSEVTVSCIKKYLDESNMFDQIKTADVVMDCLDTINTRFILQDAAQTAKVPIVSGAIAGITGQVTTIIPGDKGYELIYGDKNQTRSKGVETQTGNLGYCALLVASLQSSECIKLLLKKGKILRNQLLICDLMTNDFDIVTLA